MSNSTNLGLPFLAAAQAQKHVTHNEALCLLDTLVQLAVLDRHLAAPPASPNEGERWIVAASPTDAWAGHATHIAAWQDGAWQFSVPKIGWLAYVIDEGALLAWSGTAWADALTMLTSLQNMLLLGVGTTADATNPFSAKLNNTLWLAKSVAEGGDGDLRYKLSKESAAKTLSLLFQSALSGRAEIGLTGDDDFHFKVSADGSSWNEGIILDRSTGGVRFLANETDVASAATCNIGTAASLKVRITGTTTITSFGSTAHAVKLIRFADTLTLTHNATSLILPSGANISTAAGDTALATSDASGNWRVMFYQSANGLSGRLRQITRFTGSGTYTKPPWLKFAVVKGVGGGSGGGGTAGGASGQTAAAAGGGSGGYCEKLIFAASIGATETVTIGAAGTGGTAGNNAGSAGGNTTFGSHFTANGAATGGTGGAAGTASIRSDGPGLGGTATGGDINIPGESGGWGVRGLSGTAFGGTGGSGPFGTGGLGTYEGGTSLAATGYGAGGGGSAGTTSNKAGGAGTGGYVEVREYE